MPEPTLASEGRALGEYWQLLRDPVYRGRGVPRGDGRLVLVLPGLFGNDFYLRPLRTWLTRIGYRPVMSMIGINAGCPDRLSRRVLAAFERRLAQDAGDVAIIGHSRGGMLGKRLALALGARCTRFIALGSPVGIVSRAGRDGLSRLTPGQQDGDSPTVSASVAGAGRAVMRWLDPDCDAPDCGCDYVDALLAPWPAETEVTSIYSVEDPIVSPAAAAIAGARNIEVSGSHGGLVVNREVYPHIAAALA